MPLTLPPFLPRPLGSFLCYFMATRQRADCSTVDPPPVKRGGGGGGVAETAAKSCGRQAARHHTEFLLLVWRCSCASPSRLISGNPSTGYSCDFFAAVLGIEPVNAETGCPEDLDARFGRIRRWSFIALLLRSWRWRLGSSGGRHHALLESRAGA